MQDNVQWMEKNWEYPQRSYSRLEYRECQYPTLQYITALLNQQMKLTFLHGKLPVYIYILFPDTWNLVSKLQVQRMRTKMTADRIGS